ncbi:MAG: CoA-binding protein [Syntrophomonas sp.]
MFFKRKPNPLKEYLHKCNTIAIVGLSDDPYRASHHIAAYLQSKGYRIIPVNPYVNEVLGEKAYPDLESIPCEVDLVDIFRNEEELLPTINQAVKKNIPAIWLQLGLTSPEGEEIAREKGIMFVQDRCIMQEHRRLIG